MGASDLFDRLLSIFGDAESGELSALECKAAALAMADAGCKATAPAAPAESPRYRCRPSTPPARRACGSPTSTLSALAEDLIEAQEQFAECLSPPEPSECPPGPPSLGRALGRALELASAALHCSSSRLLLFDTTDDMRLACVAEYMAPGAPQGPQQPDTPRRHSRGIAQAIGSVLGSDAGQTVVFVASDEPKGGPFGAYLAAHAARSAMGCKLWYGGVLYGLVVAHSEEEREWTGPERRFLAALARRASQRLSRSREELAALFGGGPSDEDGGESSGRGEGGDWAGPSGMGRIDEEGRSGGSEGEGPAAGPAESDDRALASSAASGDACTDSHCSSPSSASAGPAAWPDHSPGRLFRPPRSPSPGLRLGAPAAPRPRPRGAGRSPPRSASGSPTPLAPPASLLAQLVEASRERDRRMSLDEAPPSPGGLGSICRPRARRGSLPALPQAPPPTPPARPRRGSLAGPSELAGFQRRRSYEREQRRRSFDLNSGAAAPSTPPAPSRRGSVDSGGGAAPGTPSSNGRRRSWAPVPMSPLAPEAAAVPPLHMALGLEDLEVVELVGGGSYADVYRGRWRTNAVVVRRIRTVPGEEGLEQFRTGLAALHMLRHPSLVLFMGGNCTPPNLFIVNEYLPGGSLEQRIHGPGGGPLPLSRTLELAYAVATGMLYLRRSGFPHRALRPANVFFDEDGHAKIADFGLCEPVDLEVELTAEHSQIRYCAPEVLTCTGDWPDSRFDSYSFGALLRECVTGEVPHADLSVVEVAERVARGGPPLRLPSEAARCPPALASLIADCLARDPEARPAFAEIVERIAALRGKGGPPSAHVEVF